MVLSIIHSVYLLTQTGSYSAILYRKLTVDFRPILLLFRTFLWNSLHDGLISTLLYSVKFFISSSIKSVSTQNCLSVVINHRTTTKQDAVFFFRCKIGECGKGHQQHERESEPITRAQSPSQQPT